MPLRPFDRFLASCLLCLCLAAGAATPEPRELAPGVYAFLARDDVPSPENGGFTANSGFLVGSSGVVLINPGPSLLHAGTVVHAIAGITTQPVVAVIDTHARPEQVLGSGYFIDRGVPVLASDQTVRLMQARCRRCLARLREEAGAQAMAGTEIAIPRAALRDGEVLDIGGRRLLVLAPEAGMVPGNTAILDLQSGVLFTGALLSLDHIPSLEDADPKALLATLGRLSSLPATLLVPDRGPPSPPARSEEFARYVRQLSDKARTAYASGLSLAEAAAACRMPGYADWQGYGTHQDANTRTLYLRLERAELDRP